MSLFAFGLISLLPVMAIGLTSNRQSRDEQVTSQIAQTLVEQARQETLTEGTTTFDDQGAACPASQSVYTATAAFASVTVSGMGTSSLRQLTLRIAPRGQPDRVRVYAVVLPSVVQEASSP